MNSTQIKLILKTFLTFQLIIMLMPDTVYPKMANAEMAVPSPEKAVPISETLTFYKNKQKTNKLTPEEINILNLTLLAEEVFEIKEFNLPAHITNEKDKVNFINIDFVASAIQKKIESKPDWNEAISKSKLEQLKNRSELLNTALSSYPSAIAWINYQNGLKKEAKDILSKKFEDSYTNVMKMSRVYGYNSSPMYESERLFKILKPMSNENENKTREEQLKKMRTHISSLPDLQIMT